MSETSLGFPTARVLAALGLALAPLLVLAAASPHVNASPVASAVIHFAAVVLAIMVHAERSPVALLNTPRRAAALALPALAVGPLGAYLLVRALPHSQLAEVASSALSSAAVLAVGTSLGALVGSRVLHPGHLTAVAFASSGADLWSVFAPQGVTQAVVVAATQQPAAPSFPWLRLLTVSAVMPPTRTCEPSIGFGDVVFCALYLATLTKFSAPRARTVAALALGFVSVGVVLFVLQRPIPALPFLGLCVVALVPEARAVQRKDRGATLLAFAFFAAIVARIAWGYRPR